MVIANAIGRGDRDTAQKAVHTSVLVSVPGGVLVTVLGELMAGPLLGVLHVREEVSPPWHCCICGSIWWVCR